ncbi:alginate biosynthesis sensor protein KinB [mine drainage metagenome]|uniref:histidine kinase n=1 Tax=mine drainage metagenome TaxID=410659 RepID=A0A1J5SXH4_9ZZZZ
MRLKRLVNDLVDLGALQSGAYRLELAPVKVAQFVASCLEAVMPDARVAGVSLEGGLVPGAPPILHTDEARLRQLLVILLERSVRTSASASLSLVVRRGPPTSADQPGMCAGDCLEFEVGDAPRSAAATPQAGRRAMRRSRLTAADRAGLSLALASRLCEALGGRMVVEELPGAPPRFFVWMPLGLPAAERVVEEPSWSPVLPKGV